MRLFLPHRRHALHHLQQVYFPKTCSDINPKTPNDFCCCLIQTQALGCVRKNTVNGNVQNKAHKFHFQRLKDAQREAQKLYKLLYFITCNRSALEEEQVGICKNKSS